MSGAKIVRSVQADDNHRVVTVDGRGGYQRRPCADCPWRKDAVGVFPAEAFRISAHTAYDMAQETFGCHASGTDTPRTCAGFLLRGADDNMSVRIGRIKGKYRDVDDAGIELHDSYAAMAVANGVDPDDPRLAPCRP